MRLRDYFAPARQANSYLSPSLNCVPGKIFGGIKDNDGRRGSTVIHRCHTSKSFLPSGIPQLQRNLLANSNETYGVLLGTLCRDTMIAVSTFVLPYRQ